jgi:hypothetical protein
LSFLGVGGGVNCRLSGLFQFDFHLHRVVKEGEEDDFRKLVFGCPRVNVGFPQSAENDEAGKALGC